MSLSDNQIILLVGMHRSGTSALARVWNLLGAVLPEPLVPPGVGNELGHWEPEEVVAMNDRALLSAGSDVNSAAPLPRAWIASAAGKAFQAEVTEYCRARLEAAPLTLIKDPRLSPLGRAWREGIQKLGVKPRFIIALRDPGEVAQSLTSRQLHHFPDEIWPKERAVAIWLNYVLAAEQASRGVPRTFVDYSWLLNDWRNEIARMSDQLGVLLAEPSSETAGAIDAFLKPEARRAKRDPEGMNGDLVDSAYSALLERRNDPNGGRKTFDRLQADLSSAFGLLGPYVARLEERAGEIVESRDAVRRADQEAAITRQEAFVAEGRVLHLGRTLQAAREAAAVPSSGLANTEGNLQARLDALTAAHRQVVAQAKRDRAVWEAAQLAWADERATLLNDAERLQHSHERAAQPAQLAWEKERGALLNNAGALHKSRNYAAVANPKGEIDSGSALVRLRRSMYRMLGVEAAASPAADLALLASVRTLVKQSKKHSATVETLRSEIDGLTTELALSATAYEAMRREAAALRERAEAAEDEATVLGQSLQEEIAVFASAADALRKARDEDSQQTREQKEALEGARAQLSAVYGSRTWRTALAVRRLASPARPLLAMIRRS